MCGSVLLRIPDIDIGNAVMVHPHTSCLPPGFASHALHLLQRVQGGISPIELVCTPHERWPLPSRFRCTIHTRPTLRISVLDSSFNPPTLAHLALSNAPSTSSTQHSLPSSTAPDAYDARLLLFSVRNTDKALNPGDATFIQRLEMMRLLSQEIHSANTTGSESERPQSNGNVAVAIIDEPTFVGKSTVLLRFLRSRIAAATDICHSEATQMLSQPLSPKLTFLLGFDTLARLFAPKYYPSEQSMVQMLRSFLSAEQEDCRIVCAYRRGPDVDQTNQDKVLETADEFIKGMRITFIGIGTDEQTFSSSEVRAKVAAGDETWKRLVTGAIAEYITDKQLYAVDVKKNS